ncbi:MAG: hypothetical protein EB072_02085 [Betaproteobacteria bacterium]|nr:hypothetical protein [Betaproteobacteria bacterium]
MSQHLQKLVLPTFISILSFLLIFGNQLLISYYFGTSPELDRYLTTLAAINFLLFYIYPIRETLTSSTSLSTYGKPSELNEVFSAVIAILLLLSTLLSLVLTIFHNELSVNDYVSGSKDGVLLLYILIYLFLLPISEAFNSFLIVLNLFLHQALVRLGSILTIFISIVLLSTTLGVSSLLLGLIFAQLFNIFMSGLLLMLNGLRPKWQGFRVLTRIPYAFQAFITISVTSLFGLFHAFVEKLTMLSMMPGLVASYFYGISIVNVLISVLTFPFINFIWPKFVDLIKCNEEDRIFSYACNRMRHVIILLIALASFIGYFSLEIINLLFKRGEFTSQSSMITAEMLSILLCAAIPVCVAAIFSKVLFAQKHFIIVMFSGVFSSLSGISIILIAKAIDSITLIQWNWVISTFLGMIIISTRLLIQQGNLYKTFFSFVSYTLRVCIIVSTSLFLTPPLPNGLPNKQEEFLGLLFSFFVFILIFALLAILLRVINLDYRTRKYA